MSENKHTPEPWFSQYDDNGFYEIGSESVSLRLAFTYGEGDTDEANARRITACVNACAGIDTELLEIIADNDKTLAGVIANVEKQRDELLAALERFMDSHEECTDFDGFTAQIVSMADYHQAQEAIARAKGEQ